MVVKRRTSAPGFCISMKKDPKVLDLQLMPTTPAPRRPLSRMSNLQKSISKSPKLHRQQSITPAEPEYDTNSDSNSDDSTNDSSGFTSRSSYPRSSRSPRASSTTDGDKRTPRTAPTTQNQVQRPRTSPRISGKQVPHQRNYICWVCVAVLVMVVAILRTMDSNAMSVAHWMEPEPQLDKDQAILEALVDLGRNMDVIRDKFKEQSPPIWQELEAGIAAVIKDPTRPSIFLLFSNDENPMFCLAKMIGNASKTALRADENLLVSPEDLGNDYGRALVELTERIARQKVVIVEHLLDIHPEALKAFHNLCDRENPSVKEAIYILTMIVDGYNNESWLDFVESQLTLKLEGNMDDAKVQPLITRLTDGTIIHVQPEPGVKSCPLRY
ncbi:uncharacterized protein LOC135171520 isoform X2 [Diachasmimorpha longicaudata]|uniref:uncharacterized protein LOC135171520 isoform X2 n=1 Tax=Diachasmimorpha longicaudata TaxID=58733 RepID=UPI0030B8CFA9